MAALLIPGLVFFTAIVLVAIANTQNVTTKAQTEASGSILQFFKDAITGKAVVHAITQLTRAAISRWALASLKPVTAWFVAFNALLLNIFRTQTDVIEGTATAVERIRTHTIPVAVNEGVRPVDRRARNAGAKAAGAAGAAAATHKALGKFTTHQHGLNTHYTTAIDHTIPDSFGRIRTREGQLSRDQAKLRERTKSLEDGATELWKWMRTHALSGQVGLFAGAVSIALARLGFGFLRCRNWQKLGRSLTCGMGAWLSELLALGFAYTVVVDPVKIAHAADDTIDVMESIIRKIAD